MLKDWNILFLMFHSINPTSNIVIPLGAGLLIKCEKIADNFSPRD